jgi:hypothetical protein
MIHYLVWRTLTNRHTNITLSFLPVGHTKFSPDWCFGLLKRQYRRTKVGSLQAIAEVVNTSNSFPLKLMQFQNTFVIIAILARRHSSWYQIHMVTAPVQDPRPIKTESIYSTRVRAAKPRIKTGELTIVMICKPVHLMWTPLNIQLGK